MHNTKYIGMDVHKTITVIAVLNEKGKVETMAKVQTKELPLQNFFRGISGRVKVVFEEGTQSYWLYHLLKPLVESVTVCNKRGRKKGNKTDEKDAEELARMLKTGDIKPVHKGEDVQQGLKDLYYGYEALVEDSTRIKNRVKSLYSKWAISCSGKEVFRKDKREEWLLKLPNAQIRYRANTLLDQLDQTSQLRKQAKQELIKEAKKQKDYDLLLELIGFGPIRVAVLMAVVGTPHRFRTKRQFWPYCGLSVVMHTSSDYGYVDGRIVKQQKYNSTRGLNTNYNRRLKEVFKGASLTALRYEEANTYYKRLIENGTREELARVSLARKLASIALTVWQRREKYDANKAFAQA